MIQQSELIILILALAFTPVFVWTYLGIELRDKAWLAAALAAMLVAFTATVAEGFTAAGVFHVVEHAAFAVAGVCFAVTSVALARKDGTPEEDAP